jgi:hypothetical protein
MLQDTLRQLSSHRAGCKQWSVLVFVAVLVFGALSRASTPNLLWMAAPLVLLGFAEAGYAAREAYGEQLLKNGKINEQLVVLPEESALATLRRAADALCSLSIWPFYIFLWGLFTVSAFQLPHYAKPISSALQTANANVVSSDGGNNNQPTYPPGVAPRYPNGMPYTGPYPGYPGYVGGVPRSPGANFPRPVTPGPNFAARPATPQLKTLPPVVPNSPAQVPDKPVQSAGTPASATK